MPRPPETAPAAAVLRGNPYSSLLSRMANLERQGRMLQLIAPDHLLGQGELAHMSATAESAVAAQ